MYPFLLKKLKDLHHKLDVYLYPERHEQTESAALPYHSLSPISNAEATQYADAIRWALDNRKKESIYNIALTGPYGSGKSSILQTFKAGNTNPDYVFLEISLATFKEEVDVDDDNEDAEEDEGEGNEGKGNAGRRKKDEGKSGIKKARSNEDILRLIELSILQQIFYHEEDERIPDSRFKKIRSFKKKSLRLITVGVMLALTFGLNLFYPEKVQALLKLEFGRDFGIILHWFSLGVFLAALSVAIYRSIRLVYGLKVSRLKFQEAEIEIDKNISKSILNNHLDEILYFFEVTDYSVVLIEDLDRFRQAEIFTKLRELNLLINKSKKVDQAVVFIYAVRDEIFRDKDRTKFFDFIIPVIPVINSSNSNDKLIKLVTDNNYQISSDLIDDVSLFIDDMRLLYNITNEYHIYGSLLDSALNQDKLLAMIVYKNIFPDDFVLLNDGGGKLFDLIRKRSEYVNSQIREMDEEIKGFRNEIREIERNRFKNGDELRWLYVARFVNKTEGFQSFNFSGTPVTMADATTKERFDYFRRGNFNYLYIYQQHGNYYPNNTNANFSFSDLEMEVDAEESYDSRLKRIDDLGDAQAELLKKQIQQLEKRKTAVRHAKLKELLTDPQPKISLEKNTKQDQLLSILLTSGYIDEDYLDYISLFYEGSISKADRTFLLNVKSQQPTEYEFKLSKVGNLADKIRPSDFLHDYIFNYDLLDHLISSAKFASKKSSFFGLLNDQNSKASGFIDGYVEHGVNSEVFIRELTDTWPGFWKYISERSMYPAEKIYSYYKLIIVNGTTESLRKQAENSNLIRYIETDENFFSISGDTEKLSNVIGAFNIRFDHIVLNEADKVLSDIVFKGKYYKLSPAMVAIVMKYAGKFDQPDFDQRNYYAVRNSGVPELWAYINEQINIYLEDVYFKIPDNGGETEEDIIALLENKNISDELMEKLIAGSRTRISDLGEMSNEVVDELLFKHNKLYATWKNLAYDMYRHEDIFSNSVSAFLNIPENAGALGNEEMDNEALFGDDERLDLFLRNIIYLDGLSDENFELLSGPFPDDINVNDIPEASEEKMKILIAGFHILPSSDNFLLLKKKYSTLHLFFLEFAVDDVLSYQNDYELNTGDLTHIMRIPAFSKDQKLEILKTAGKDMVLKSNMLLLRIGQYIVSNFPFPVEKDILIAALQQSMPINDRVKLFNMHYNQFSKEDIPVIFETFPDDFRDIGRLTFSPTVDITEENGYLANNLLERGFISKIKYEKNKIRLINFKKNK